VNIIIQYDSSTATAPAGFFSAVQYAVAQADALIADNITIPINFGWGEVGGQTLTPGAVGSSLTPPFILPYGQVVAAMRAHETTYDDYKSLQSLPTSDPTFGRGIDVSLAQALALGLPVNLTGAIGGSVGLDSSSVFEWNQTSVPGAYDAIGILYHEISEVLGRISDAGGTTGRLTIFDFFRSNASGAHTTATTGAYFSADGQTISYPFNDPATGGDSGDWATSLLGDAFAKEANPGPPLIITMPDLRVLDVLGFRLATPVETAIFPAPGTTPYSGAPVIAVFLNEPVTAGTGNIVIHRSSDGAAVQSVPITDPHVSVANGIVSTPLPYLLQLGTSYYVTMDPGTVKDAQGNGFIGLGGDAGTAFTTPTPAQEAAFWLTSVLRDGVSSSALALGHQLVSTLASDDQLGSLNAVIQAAASTTSVATLAYEFFTGSAPSSAGMDYLVSTTGPNPNNLNSTYYQSFSLENRYINFAVNLGKLGAGQASFQAQYGSLSLFEATRKAYATIFGGAPSDAKLHALLDPSFTIAGQTMTRADYFASYGGDGSAGIGTKAAMVGWLMAEAVKADLGTYAKSNDAFLTDVALHNASFGVDLIGHYAQAGFAFQPG